MKKKNSRFRALMLCVAASLSLTSSVRALTYTNQNLEMMLCFRQSGTANPFDLEVNIGSVTKLIALPVGTTIPVANFSLAQLENAMASTSFENVGFSVTAASFAGDTTTLGTPVDTIWATIPRADPSSPNLPWTRQGKTVTAGAANPIYSIGSLAANFSRIHVSDPLVNDNFVVGIPPGNAYSCEGYLGSSGDINGSYFIVENLAIPPFTSPIVSDFFMEVPNNFADPLNGNAKTGLTDYLGYFTFSPSGALTFTRESHPTSSGPPPQPTLQISVTSTSSTISFDTTNGATYILLYTNFAGLSAPRDAWPTLGAPILGNGSTTNFTDSTATEGRIYSVTAH
jgi:hypothetical protein